MKRTYSEALFWGSLVLAFGFALSTGFFWGYNNGYFEGYYQATNENIFILDCIEETFNTYEQCKELLLQQFS
jgi:hypothetical protein